ncbi:MAG: enoyl-CoA hydratase/isomerase family protein, partial [Pseudomonadales bacterium]|nr:enoyl-CoA hydratase/isomerase family protein [Pseudomonadales bacterium]
TGFGVGNELMLTGKTVDANEALAIGIADRVVPPAELLGEAQKLARSMGENPQSALRMIKQLITENMGETDLTAVQKREGEALAQCYKSPEHHEAINAFLEKRAPDFRGARSGS